MAIRTTKDALGLTNKGKGKRTIHGAATSRVLVDAEALEGILRGLADVKAGRTKPARRVFARLRRKHCGLLPILKYANPKVAVALRTGGRTMTDSRERHRARALLVTIQVGTALVLLVSSGLMLRTFQTLSHVNQFPVRREIYFPALPAKRRISVLAASFAAAVAR